MIESPKKRAKRSKEGLELIEYTRQKMTREFFQYMFMAIFNSIFFAILFYILHEAFVASSFSFLNQYPETIAWFLSFAIGTVEAHYVHRRFTFKSTAPYKESLYWMFAVYSIIGVLSSITIWGLVHKLHINAFPEAWVINNALFGLVYFAGLRLLAFPPEVASEDE